MLISCWSPKGGAGTTVVTAALGLVLAARPGVPGVLLVDLAGDLPAALGLGPGGGLGLTDWLAAAPEVPGDALSRLEAPAGPSLAVVPRGAGPLEPGPGGAELLAAVLAAERRPVVVDCGRIDADLGPDAGTALALAAASSRSLLVLRPCFLAVRRAAVAPLVATGIVLVDEPGRSLAAADVEAATGVPIVARVRTSDRIARTVDSGLLVARPPRSLLDDLRDAA